MPALRPLLDDAGQPSSGSPLQIGQVIHGKYRIERQIGRGGMGIVLAATHLQLEHLVAIKVMRRDLGMDERAIDRLLMEARSAARIRSEHVARVLDVGTLDNGTPFIVMEYLDGENLADLLDREGALQIDQAVSFMLQCCLALAEVHVAEMVHRDLKPGNLFIARLPDGSPSVKIVDFGISKQIGSARDGAATTSPQVLGSPYYMSPEQMRAEAVDERSDIWGLGAILFEMLTGRPPFIGDTLPEVYSAVLNDAPPPVDTLRSSVPAGLDDVVQRCLEKDPAQRFCDVADLAEALAPFAIAAAPSVERITRILMNPEAVRARYSLLPGGAVAVAVAEQGRSALNSGILQSDQRLEGMMAGDADDEADGAADRRSSPEATGAPHGGTLLESEAAQRSNDAAWGPSRPPLTAEFAALSATGVRTGRTLNATHKRLGWLLAGVSVLGALALFWVVMASRQSPARSPLEPSPAEPARTLLDGKKSAEPAAAAAPPAPSAPRVTPLIVPGETRPPSSQSPALPGASAPRPRTDVLGLQPSAGAKPRVGSSSAPSSGHPGGASTSTSESASRAVSPEAAPSRAAASAHVPPARGEDPWNPDSFGDRR
jgi:Protein kinase domain